MQIFNRENACARFEKPSRFVFIEVVLMGDHCQLPPTICSEVAKAEGLETSFFERMVMQGIQPVLLDTQYPEFFGARTAPGGK